MILRRLFWRLAALLPKRGPLSLQGRHRRRPNRLTFLGSSRKTAERDESTYETIEVDRATGGIIRRHRSLSAYMAAEGLPPCEHAWRPMQAVAPVGNGGPWRCAKCGAELGLPRP